MTTTTEGADSNCVKTAMESTESYAAGSPEELAKRSPEPHDSSEADSAEKPTHIRFLVSNAAAGSVIGKGGSTITEFQAKSGARIQLSRNQEFFPGTTDRIIMISGSIKEVVNGLELILDKLHSELHAEDGNEVEQPKSLCDTVLKNMYDVDYIHQAISEAIEQEIDWKTEGVCQMSQNF